MTNQERMKHLLLKCIKDMNPNKVFQMKKFEIIISCFLIIISSCQRASHDISPYYISNGDTIPLYRAIHIDFNDDEQYSSYYHSSTDSLLIAIDTQILPNGSSFCDTTEYLILKDSIIDLSTDRYYLVHDGLITGKKTVYGGFEYLFKYQDNRLVLSGTKDADGNIGGKGGNSTHYTWENNKITSVTWSLANIARREIRLTYKDHSTSSKTKDGALGFYIDEFVGWQGIPFLLLGYFGDIPGADLSKKESYDLQDGQLFSTASYKNSFDKDGMLKTIEFKDRGVTLEILK